MTKACGKSSNIRPGKSKIKDFKFEKKHKDTVRFISGSGFNPFPDISIYKVRMADLSRAIFFRTGD
jgi:hypothetical protein